MSKLLTAPLVPLLLAAACATPGVSASPGASASSVPSSATASQAPSASIPAASQTASASADAPPEGSLAVGDWVEVTADNLNLRAQAGINARTQGRLPAGSTGSVAAGPVEADGYTWYAVAAPGIPSGSGCVVEPDPRVLSCPGWFGWLAAGDQAGNPWLVRASPPCPDTPTTAADIGQGPPGVMYACFRGQTLTIDAYVGELDVMDCVVPYAVTPDWLWHCNSSFLHTSEALADSAPWLAAQVDPSLGTCTLGGRQPATCPFVAYLGQYIQVDGHYEDPAAETCVSIAQHPVEIDPAQVVYRCREAFVITAIRPSDGP